MIPEDRADRIASLKRQLFFHQGRRKMVESDPELTPNERVEEPEFHDRLVTRLLGQRIDQEGHEDARLGCPFPGGEEATYAMQIVEAPPSNVWLRNRRNNRRGRSLSPCLPPPR